jgi:glyoxylase-like metal-dependent hydrolase (beta-lactamase superfamily II)
VIEALDAFDVVRVRADNASPLTLDGTNTWVLGRDPAWVVDPGPALPAHLDAVVEAVSERGGAGGVVLTHSHADHSEGAAELAERLGAPLGEPGPLEVLPLPGHAEDHVVFVWREVCCTGDAVLGEGSVFVAGDMGAYLDGLRALRERELRLICPGHGPPVLDPLAKLDGYLEHRLEREARLVAALHAGVRGDDALLDTVWDDAPAHLRPAAALTMHAHLRKLDAEGRLPADVSGTVGTVSPVSPEV